MVGPLLRRTSLAVLLLTASACGLHAESDAQLQDALRVGGVVDPGIVAADPGTDPGVVGGVDTGVPGVTGGVVAGPGGSPGQAPTTGSAPGKASAPTLNNSSVGISATEIKIGIHAPLSGASPLPEDSFKTGKELYWKTRRVFGRKVVIEVLDDTYKPSGAIKVCEDMARRDFIVLGGAGTDQIQACGRNQVLRRLGVPYLSAGVTANGLSGIPTYWALSLTYPQQADLVIEAAKLQGFLHGTPDKWGLVISNTPNFKDAQDAMEAALKKAGIEYKVFLVPKAGSQADAAALANDLRAYGAPTVFFLGQPTFFINTVTSAAQQLYLPIWTGVGPSMGVNTVAEVACASTGARYDGRFLSPFPGLDKAPKEFFDAGGKDDIELSLWGSSELLYNLLLATKGNLTRGVFNAAMTGAKYGSTTFPGVHFKGDSHFGGTGTWILKSNCSTRIYDTVGEKPLYIK